MLSPDPRMTYSSDKPSFRIYCKYGVVYPNWVTVRRGEKWAGTWSVQMDDDGRHYGPWNNIDGAIRHAGGVR